jgi:heme oxygenase (mycobilin-producing)
VTKGDAVFVVLSRFVVVEGMAEAVKAAFLARPRLVEQAPGFQRMEVLIPQGKPEEFWLMTWWQDEASFDVWHHSHEYHESHRHMPKGLKLVPGSTEIRRFDLIAQ